MVEWIKNPSSSILKEIIFSEEFIDSYLFNNIDSRPLNNPNYIVLGHSAGYYIFPKGSKGNWKFQDSNLNKNIIDNFIGLFSGGDYPIFHINMMKFIDSKKKLLKKDDYLLLTLADVPLGNQYDESTEKLFFEKWHNHCNLFLYENDEIIIKKPNRFFIDWRICNVKRFTGQIRTGFFNFHNSFINKKLNSGKEIKPTRSDEDIDEIKRLFKEDFIERNLLPVDKVFNKKFVTKIKQLQERGIKIVFIYLPQGSVRHEYVESIKGYEYYKLIANNLNIPFWDFYNSLEDNKFLENDYIHLNKEGANEIIKSFNSRISELK